MFLLSFFELSELHYSLAMRSSVISPIAIHSVQSEVTEYISESELLSDEDFHVIKKRLGAQILYKRLRKSCFRISQLVSKSNQSPRSARFSDPIKSDHLEFSSPVTRDGKQVLQFASDFEGGNLKFASVTSSGEYILCVAPDASMRATPTKSGPAFNFYFAVRNRHTRGKVSFKIINLNRNIPLYSKKGLRIWTYSENRIVGKKGWRHCGADIQLEPNCLYDSVEASEDSISDVGATPYRKKDAKFTLSFKFNFEIDNDCNFISFSIPYTYTMLNRFLSRISDGERCKRFTLCKTQGGLACEGLKISNSNLGIKHPVFIISRIHPSESVASWMVHGFVEWLLSDSPEARASLDACDFMVIPMMNPDGVAMGNTRYDIMGLDMNRQWLNGRPIQIAAVLALMRSYEKADQSILIDFHGHARRRGFFYFISARTPTEGTLFANITESVLKRENAANGPTLFARQYCSLLDGVGKQSTARVVSIRNIGMRLAVTVEASAFAGLAGRAALFTPNILKKIGECVGKSLVYWLEARPLREIGLSRELVANVLPRLADEDSKSMYSDSASETEEEAVVIEYESFEIPLDLVQISDERNENFMDEDFHFGQELKVSCKRLRVKKKSREEESLRRTNHPQPGRTVRSQSLPTFASVCSVRPDCLMIAPNYM
jgi:hypothetical protein